ncbi:MAG: hypothetical protein O3A12_00750 [Actinobacteria bacterium]|nr:hypothetical protein [Actinomycetota bacterium]MDA2985329.1 hypothetical protein [Actinomycetota bacterium]
MSNLTVGIIIDGFHEDAITSIQSIMEYSGAGIALLINGKQEPLALPTSDRIRVFEAKQKLGWGNAANFLLENSEKKYLALMDPSTTFTGDAAALVEEKLDEGYKGVGWRGGLINIEDEWRSVDDKGPGEVDVLFSYFMALDREFAQEIGANPSSKYYRNADMELSLALREAGARLYQIDLPLQQGRHHGYYDVDESYREKHSKDNYNRILKRFRGKNDILSPRR